MLFITLFKSGRKLWPAMVSLARASLPSLFSMLWPLITIIFFGKRLWGECVDGWLYFQLTSLFISWGNRQYLLKKFDLMPRRMNESFSESFYSRSMLFGVFMIFAICSPFGWKFKLAASIYTIGRFINNSFDPVIEYKRKYFSAILAEVLGFIKGAALVYSVRGDISPSTILLCLSLGELVKAILILLLVRDIRLRFSWSYFNFNYYIQSFPFFIYAFAVMVVYLVDRMYVYSRFAPEDKAFYQILMNMLIFILAVPGFLLVPFLKNYYRGKVLLTANIRFSIFIGGFTILPVLIIISYLLITYLYGFPLNWQYVVLSVFFCFPAFVYSPIFYYLVGKNQQFVIATSCFVVSLFLLMLCPYLIDKYGLEGALFTASLGQWGLMVSSLIIYFQERSAKKIRLIK